MANHIVCLLCSVSGLAELVSPTLRDDSSGRFKVFRCLRCGHVQLFPLPSREDDVAFYNADRQTRNLLGEVDFEQERRNAGFDTARRVRWVRSLLPDGGTVLDVGCGYGFFVDAMVQAGYDAAGIDMSEERYALARRSLRGTFIQGEIDEPFVAAHVNQFSVVAMFHVLEHVRAPVVFLQRCFSLVAPGGHLLIEVPNLGDELLSEQPEYRAFYWQRAHLSYFDAARLGLAMDRACLPNPRIRGVQRYGLRNLVHWLDEHKPQLVAPDFQATEPILWRVEELYRADRERSLSCDTLIDEVRK